MAWFALIQKIIAQKEQAVVVDMECGKKQSGHPLKGWSYAAVDVWTEEEVVHLYHIYHLYIVGGMEGGREGEVGGGSKSGRGVGGEEGERLSDSACTCDKRIERNGHLYIYRPYHQSRHHERQRILYLRPN